MPEPKESLERIEHAVWAYMEMFPISDRPSVKEWQQDFYEAYEGTAESVDSHLLWKEQSTENNDLYWSAPFKDGLEHIFRLPI